MADRDGNPACITIFSAPNYCGQWGNKGALFVSRPQAVDVLTFEECQEKPIVLQMEGKIDPSTGEPVVLERVDMISYMMDRLVGYTTQAILGLYMMSDDPLSRAISSQSSDSQDVNYKRAIIYESYRQDKKYAGQDHMALAEKYLAEESKRDAAMTEADRDEQ